MPTAIIGVGNIGAALAQELVDGGEPVVLAAETEAKPAELAARLGARATASSVPDAIAAADAVLLALWLDPMKEVIESCFDALEGKVVIDPSNPIASDGKGGFARTLPDGVSAGSVVAGMLPGGAHYVKAFGTLSAETLASAANREPERVVLFYATDDAEAESVAERLITEAGFAPVKAGGVDDALRIEVGGELHQLGGLEGKLLDLQEAHAAIAASPG